MNKSFKVVFSKARSALMVVNEATSSVQAKGTKTVVATAVAAMIAGVAGTAMAEGAATTPLKAPVVLTEGSFDEAKSYDIIPVESNLGALSIGNKTQAATVSFNKGLAVTSTYEGTSHSEAIRVNGSTLNVTGATTINMSANGGIGAANSSALGLYVRDYTGMGSTATLNGNTNITVAVTGNTTDKDKVPVEAYGISVQSVTSAGASLTIKGDVLNLNVSNVGNTACGASVAFSNAPGAALDIQSKKVILNIQGADRADRADEPTANDAANGLSAAGGTLTVHGDLSGTVSATGDARVSGLTVANVAKTGSSETVYANGVMTLLGNVDLTVTGKDSVAVASEVMVLDDDVADPTATVIFGSSEEGAAATTVKLTAAKAFVGNGDIVNNTAVMTLSGTVNDFTGDYTQNGGSLTLTDAANKFFGGDVTIAGGTFNAETATVAGDKVLSLKGGKSNIKTVALTAENTDKNIGGAGLEITGGENTIGTLTVNAGASASAFANAGKTTMSVVKDGEAELALGNEADEEDFIKVTTLTNAGEVTLGEGVVVTTFNNDLSANLTGAKIGDLKNSKTGVVTVESDSTIANLTNEASGSVVIEAGTLKLTGKSTNAGKITSKLDEGDTSGVGTLKVTGGELANTGVISVHELTVADGGKLTSSFAFNPENKTWAYADTINVNKDGTLNVAALNGMFKDGSAAKPDDTDAAQKADALVLPQGTLVLKGGSVTVNNVAPAKVVVASGAAVDIESGDYSIGSLKTLGTGEAILVNGGSLSVTDALVTTNVANVKIAEKGTLNLTADSIGIVIDNKGVLSGAVDADNYPGVTNQGTVVVSGLDGKTIKYDNIDDLKGNVATGGIVKLGKLQVTDLGSGYSTETDTITADSIANLAGLELDQFKNTTVTKVENGRAVAGSFGAIEMASGATNVGASVAADTVLKLNNSGKIVAQYGGEKVGNLAVEGTLITTGANAEIGALTGTEGKVAVEAGSLTVNGVSSIKTLAVDGALTMGTAARASGATTDPDPYKLTVTDKITVAGTLTALGEVDVKGGSIAGTANLGKLTVAKGVLGVTGVADVKELVNGTVTVGDKESAGALNIAKMTNGAIFADPAWVDGVYNPSRVVVAEMAGGSVEAGRNSIAVIGTTAAVAEAAVANAGFRIEKVLTDVMTGKQTNIGAVNSVAYVAGVVAEGEDYAAPISANIAATDRTLETYTTAVNTLTVNSGSLLYVDMANFDRYGDAAVFGTYTTPVVAGTVFLGNVANGDVYNLGASVGAVSRLEDHVFFTGDMLMQPKVAANKLSVTMLTVEELEEEAEGITDVVGFDAAYAYFKERANLNNTSKSAQFNNWLWSEATTNAAGINTVAQLGQIADDVASIAGTAGMVNVTMDALSQFNDTVSARTSILARNGEGVNVWADVNGGKFEGKKVIAGAGYSSDIYAGVLGVDTTVACGAKIGAALTIGTADTDSKNTSAVTSMDSDLVGFSVYTSKTFGDIWNVAADIGYIQASNEVTTKAYNLGKFDADSNAFTFGIRGEVLTKAGALDIVPHAGLRYTRVDVDSFEAGFVTDYEAMNVFQLPVGVTVSGELEVAGWNVAPAFDLTFVPTWGDKNADLTLGINGASVKEAGTLRVLDSNVVNATLGVAAQNGAWTFGLDYKLGVGSDDRMDNTFNVNVRYAF